MEPIVWNLGPIWKEKGRIKRKTRPWTTEFPLLKAVHWRKFKSIAQTETSHAA